MSLDLIRNKNKWLTRFILILIAVVFIFGFGFSFVNFGSVANISQGTAAEVNGDPISLTEYYRVRDRLYSQFEQQGELPESLTSLINIRALNQLIDLKLLYQNAKKFGINITEDELKDAITSNPAFQIDGEFIGYDAYRNFIQQGLKEQVGEFEQRYKEELIAQKLIDFINQTVKISEEELLNLYRVQNERVKIAYIKFSPNNYLDKVEFSEGELIKFYESNKSKYYFPQQKKIKYIKLTPADFEKDVSVSDEEIKAFYDSFKNEYLEEDGEVKPFEDIKPDIRAQLISGRVDVLQAKFIQGIDKKLESSNLVKLASQFGENKINEATINPKEIKVNNDFPMPVVVKIDSANKGDKFHVEILSDIWIVELIDIMDSKLMSLEEAKDLVSADLRYVKAKELAQSESKKIYSELKQSKIRFSDLDDKYSLKPQETDYFTRLEKIDGLDSFDLRLDAFQRTKNSSLSNQIYDIGDDLYIFSFIDKKEPDINEYENKKKEIKQVVLSNRINNTYNNWINSFRKKAEIIPNVNLFPNQG